MSSSLNMDTLSYDIWENAASGITIAAPEGVELDTEGDNRWVAFLKSGATLHVRFQRYPSDAAVQQAATRTEFDLYTNSPTARWSVDPSWS